MKKSKFDKLSSFFQKHWFIVILVPFILSLWSMFLTYGGIRFALTEINNTNGKLQLTLLGGIITGIIVLINLAIIIFNKYISLNNERTSIDSLSRYSIINLTQRETTETIKHKVTTLVRNIDKINDGTQENDVVVISRPADQISQQLTCLQKCLQELLSTDGADFSETDDLYVSLAYRFPGEKNDAWQWARNRNVKSGLELQELISPARNIEYNIENSGDIHSKKVKSTFYHLSKEYKKQVFIFYNSKQEAFEKGVYIPDGLDGCGSNLPTDLKGSIACYHLDIYSEKEPERMLVEAILSISSYNFPFIPTEYYTKKGKVNKNLEKEITKRYKNNIVNHVLSHFLVYIKESLCLQYIKDHFEEKEVN